VIQMSVGIVGSGELVLLFLFFLYLMFSWTIYF
jgi:hypothetical protein